MKFNKTTFRLSRYHGLTTKELESQLLRLFLFKKKVTFYFDRKKK